MDTPTTVGSLIAAARRERKITLRELAASLGGLSIPFVHDVENDRRLLPAARLGALRKALPMIDARLLAEAEIRAGTITLDPGKMSERAKELLLSTLVAIAEDTEI